MSPQEVTVVYLDRRAVVFILFLNVWCFHCQRSKGSAEQQQKETYRVSGVVTLDESVELHVTRGIERPGLFLFLTRSCPNKNRIEGNLVSELQIPAAYSSTTDIPNREVPFEFFGIEEGEFYLSGFVNVSEGYSEATEYGLDDIVRFENGEVGCLRLKVGKDETPHEIRLTLNHVVSLQDPKAFLF